MQRNVLAMSGRAVEAAGDVNTLLLDKTGTITFGEPSGHRVPPPAPGVTVGSWPTPPSSTSLADETPEARSIVVLAKEHFGLRGRAAPRAAFFVSVHGADAHERGWTSTGGRCARVPPTP